MISLDDVFEKIIHIGVFSQAFVVRSNSLEVSQLLQKLRFMFCSWRSWAREKEVNIKKQIKKIEIDILVFIGTY